MSDVEILSDLYPTLSEYTAPVKPLERKLVGRKGEMRSLMAAMMRPELCNVILLAEAGSGKALENGTEIPLYMSADGLECGHRKIEDLSENDFVFDETGQPVRVAGVFPQGRKRAYRVTFSDGSQIVCNDEHLWTARNQYRHYLNRPYRTYTLRQMMDDGLVFPNGSYRWYIPAGGAVYRPEARVPVSPYLIGAVLGAGGIGFDKSIRFFVKDRYVLDKIGRSMGFGVVEFVSTDHGMGFLMEKAGNDPIMWDDLFGRPDLQCLLSDGRIPDAYKLGSIEQRWALLNGLMDSGGKVFASSFGKCAFLTRNRNLADDVHELACSLGVRAEVRPHDSGYAVRFFTDDETKLKLFTSPDKRQKLAKYQAKQSRPSGPFSDLCITSVEDLGYDVEMTCIYVDSPSHLFVAGRDHIVTHNTALVQGTMMQDTKRLYLEVDLAKMISALNDPNEMAAKLKTLFHETGVFCQNEKKEIVLFIDEFHQIVQLSDAAVEALKPLLADSGTRGIRVIAATTYIEFQQFVSPNQPLVERLQRINLSQPDKEMTVAILKGMAERYGVASQFYNDRIYELIYEYTERYVPASSQPRKSLTVMDAMIGWHRAEGRKLDQKLLADVIYESQGVNVAFRVDATTIKERLDQKVLSQQFATSMIEQRLQICVADLNDKTKPMSSFLFCGSTGVGKTEMVKSLAEVLFDDRKNLIRFDMSEYANSDSLERFRSELTSRVWERPYSIVLLDEIEKSCAPVTRLLLQVLDDARLSDANGRQVSFVNSYFVLTTNSGSEVFRTIAQYNVDDTGSGTQMARYNKLIRSSITATNESNKFPPELLGRIDCLVPFQPLSSSTMEQIILMKLRKLKADVLQKHNVRLNVGKKLIRYIVYDNLDTDSDSGGARAAVSKLESEVTTALARYINAHPGCPEMSIVVRGEMACDHEDMLESKAHVEIVNGKDGRSPALRPQRIPS